MVTHLKQKPMQLSTAHIYFAIGFLSNYLLLVLISFIIADKTMFSNSHCYVHADIKLGLYTGGAPYLLKGNSNPLRKIGMGEGNPM